MELRIEKIQEWIKLEIIPNLIKTINTKHTSYSIKHICEKDLGFYVSNEEIKVNMDLLGIEHKKVSRTSENCYFAISENWFKLKKQMINERNTDEKKRN